MNHTRQTGFSLVEIMVALAIGIFLTVTVIELFLSTKQSNRIQENLSRMQENARFAMNFLSEDIRNADYWGGECIEAMLKQGITNHLDATHVQYDPQIHGFADTLLNDVVTGTEGTADANNSAFDEPDSITLRSFFNVGKTNPLVSITGTDITITGDSGFAADDIALITDCNAADVFQVNAVNQDGAGNDILQATLGGGGNTNAPGNASEISRNYSNATVWNITSDTQRSYGIDCQSANDNPVNCTSAARASSALERGSDDLVDNIENLQIVYGVNDGGRIYYAPWDQVNDPENIISVEVSLLLRSPDDNLTTVPQSLAYNGNQFVANDRRLYQVYTLRIAIRNRLQ